jgi:hypothetical protein
MFQIVEGLETCRAELGEFRREGGVFLQKKRALEEGLKFGVVVAPSDECSAEVGADRGIGRNELGIHLSAEGAGSVTLRRNDID